MKAFFQIRLWYNLVSSLQIAVLEHCGINRDYTVKRIESGRFMSKSVWFRCTTDCMGKTDLVTLRLWQGIFKSFFRKPCMNTHTCPP